MPRWKMYWDSTKVATGTEVTGLGDGVCLAEPFSGAVKPCQVHLKYSAFKGDPLLMWRQQVVDGKMAEARRNIAICVDEDARPRITFALINAWPAKYIWSSAKSKTLEVTVILQHEGERLVTGPNQV
jgi:phage tail-like protein